MYFNIIVTGKNDADHLASVNRVLQRMQAAGLKLELEKCSFLANEVVYPDGVAYTRTACGQHEKKVEAVMKAQSTKDVKQLQRYLGLINFYRRFPPDLSLVL